MNPKYVIDTKENRDFLSENAKALLDFGREFPNENGCSYYLGDDGKPWKERNVETWITCRMAHVYSIGAMMGDRDAKGLAAKAIRGLRESLADKDNGGWYAALTPDGMKVGPKQCYAHAFVILAATSACLADINGANELLEDALAVYDKRFWDESIGLAYDTWDIAFEKLDSYRGVNANMHTVEAFLAVADTLEDNRSTKYRDRAGRIIKHVTEWAKHNNYRIPEHFNSDWEPELDKNIETPNDPFKPYGATPGHGIEWARLISQWACSDENLSDVEKRDYIDVACSLYMRAKEDAWNADGAPGYVYTTDWDGKPVVHDRMHWTLAEAINTAAVLYRITGKQIFADDYATYMEYLDTTVIDHSCGSWFHQLDEHNRLIATVWPGKSDIYHAYQSCLIPYSEVGASIAKAMMKKEASGKSYFFCSL